MFIPLSWSFSMFWALTIGSDFSVTAHFHDFGPYKGIISGVYISYLFPIIFHHSERKMKFVMKYLACNNILSMKVEDGGNCKECVAVLS